MNKGLSICISLTLCLSTFVCPLLYTTPAIAGKAPQLQEVKKKNTSETQNAEKKTMSQRVEEAMAGNSDTKVSKIPAGEAYIPSGTELTVEIVEELNSKKTKTHEVVPLKLAENLIINDVIVIPAGTTVEGHITKARGSGLFGRAGLLEFSVDSVKTVNNVTVPLEYVGRIQARNDTGAIPVYMMVSMLGGVLMRGANVRIPAGTKVLVKVTEDTDLMTKIDKLNEAMDPNKPHGVTITLK